jgi:hypothetical protein
MAGFRNVRELVDAELAGQSTFFTWRKSPTAVSTVGIWLDLSMSPGNPIPQYYAATPLVSVQMSQSVTGGLYHSGSVYPKSKFVKTLGVMATAATATPMAMILLDYLLYYPFIDEGNTDEQFMNVGVVNPAGLSRSTDGKGVQIMAVSVAARTGGQKFTVNYTNQDGIAGRTTIAVVENTATATGNIVSCAPATNLSAGPFLPLQLGDTGVRSIQSVTMQGADVGLFTLVLVKPIETLSVRGIDAFCEKNCFMDGATIDKVDDDAYLNFICLPQGTLNATALHGYMSVVWN